MVSDFGLWRNVDAISYHHREHMRNWRLVGKTVSYIFEKQCSKGTEVVLDSECVLASTGHLQTEHGSHLMSSHNLGTTSVVSGILFK